MARDRRAPRTRIARRRAWLAKRIGSRWADIPVSNGISRPAEPDPVACNDASARKYRIFTLQSAPDHVPLHHAVP